MLLTKLQQFAKDIDIFISQHAIYINKLEKAIKEGTTFEHKDCHSCAFGKKFDELVVPVKDHLPKDILIDPQSRKPSDEENSTISKAFKFKAYTFKAGGLTWLSLPW